MCKNPKEGYLFFNSTKCSPKKMKKKKNDSIQRTAKVNITSINIITRFYHHADSLQEICIQPFKVLFEIILIAATPCYFFLFHCINKREVRPASLRSRSFRASSSKRLLSYTAWNAWSLLFMVQKWLQKFEYYQRVYVLTRRCWA